MSETDTLTCLPPDLAEVSSLVIIQLSIGVAISTFFRRSRDRLRPNCGRMAAQPKLNLCLSSIPTAAANGAEIMIIFGVIRAAAAVG